MYREKIDEMEEKEDIQDWDKFVKKIKIAFSNKSKIADTKWKIKLFRQKKKETHY